jgi:hypothetical protein
MTTEYSIDDHRLIAMGVLPRPQHEAFAQLIASGSTIVDAYEKAGYPRNRSNACRLRLRERISARIDELVAQKSAAASLAELTAAEKAGVDAFWVMRTLRRNAVMAARAGDRAASNRAAELIGKHLGMFFDKKSIEISYVDDADEYLARIMEIVNAKVIDHEPAPLQLENDGLKDGSDDQI